MPVARGKGVCDFMKQRVADLLLGVEEHEVAGQGDCLLSVAATSKTTAGVVEAKGPAGEFVLLDQQMGERPCFVEMQGASDPGHFNADRQTVK